MGKQVKVIFHVSLLAQIKKSGKCYVSSCPALDVHSQGSTKKRARENLVEALELFLVSCFERGVLDRVLKDCGFEALHKMPRARKPEHIGHCEIIDVPLAFAIPQKAAELCRA